MVTFNYEYSELEKKILNGLSAEWDLAVNELDFVFYEKMKKPVFSLDNSGKILGRYVPETNEISFSRNFVLNYPWYALRDVLLHEMAHQFDFMVFGGGEKPHGKNFHEACRILRADPSATAHYKKTDDHEEDELDNNDKILSKVRKLLALAGSSNINEAESAMQKAHFLIARYNIEFISGKEKRNYRSVFLGKPKLRHFKESYYLSRLITDNYYVEGIWVSSFVVDKGKVGKVFEISGTNQNIQIADYVYNFVNRFIEREWEQFKKNRKYSRSRKTDFAIGIIEGFRSKLEKGRVIVKESLENRDLINIKDKGLVGFFNQRYPRQRTIQRKSSSHDRDIMDYGFSLGKKLIISKGIKSDSGRNGRLLSE